MAIEALIQESKPNVIVVGGSYVGSKVVDDLIPLVGNTHNIIMIDKSTHFQNIFALPRLHAVSGFERKAFVPYSSEYFKEAHDSLPKPSKHAKHAQIVNGLVTSILPDKVVLQSGESIPYEYLVLATGTRQRMTLGSESLSCLPQGKNDKEKGLGIIHTWQTDVKLADRIVVVGGGAYGIQLAADIKTHEPTSSKQVTLLHSRSHLMNAFHHKLHDITMEKMDEIGVDVVLGQRATKIEKDDSIESEDAGQYVVHLSGGGHLRADLVITCLGGAPLSEPLRTLAPSAINSQTGYIRVLPTLQIDASDPSSSSSTLYPNIFALGDVADTGAHKAAGPGHFQSGVVTRNIARLIKSKSQSPQNQVRRLPSRAGRVGRGIKSPANITTSEAHVACELVPGRECDCSKAKPKRVWDIWNSETAVDEDESLESEKLESYVPSNVVGIHLRLGMRDSLVFRNPPPGSDTPYVCWDEKDSATLDCGSERYWKRRAQTLWKNQNLDA